MGAWTNCENCGCVAEAHADLKATPDETPCEGMNEGDTCSCPGYKGFNDKDERIDDSVKE